MDLEGHEYSVPSQHSGSELLSLGPSEHVFLLPQTSLATGSLLYMGSREANGVCPLSPVLFFFWGGQKLEEQKGRVR